MASKVFRILAVAAILTCTSVTSHAMEVLGIGSGSLLGGDLTDVDDVHDETAYAPPANFGGFDAEFFSSDEPGFGGGEFAFNVFDNAVGATNDKWCCGTSFPQIVGAVLPQPYFLTHFTLASGNDTDNRRPRVWTIDGSNDGVDWTTIFSQNDPNTPLWDAHNQVIRFDAGADFSPPSTAYTQFRLNVTATGATTGAFFQVNEFELFGVLEQRESPYLPVNLPGPNGGAGAWGVREITNNGTIDSLLTAVDSATNGGGTIIDGQFSILDVTDPDTNPQGGPVLSSDPFPFLSDSGADDDNITTVAKAKVRVEQGGDYTFLASSNDGFGLRFRGQEFTSSSNGAIIDQLDPTTLVRLGAGQGLGVVNLEPGEYDVDFVSWEGTGEGFYEVASAQGVITDPELAQWIAVGDTSSVAEFSKTPTIYMPESASACNMGSVPEVGGVAAARAEFLAGRITACGETEIIALYDPESGNDLGGTATPFPSDTVADDDEFSTAVFGNFTLDDGDSSVGEDIRLTFAIQSDDNGQFQIVGASFDPNGLFGDTRTAAVDVDGDLACTGDFNSGNINSVCQITLTEGEYDFLGFHREQGGGAYYQVWWAEGDHTSFDASEFTPLSTDATPTVIPANTGLALVGDGGDLRCDFDGDGACGVGDVDLLMIEVGAAAKAGGAVAGPAPTPFDLTNDGVVDDLDRDEWLALAAEENGLSAPYQLGDTNLDLIVNATDLNEVGISWQLADEHRWSKGNFTGGGVNAPDLNEVGINWQQRHPDAPAGANTVPEPSGLMLLLLAMLAVVVVRQ